jgi:hypothetical protein
MTFIYWIKFDKCIEPEKIKAIHTLEFIEILKQLIERTGEMPEWIIRDYK